MAVNNTSLQLAKASLKRKTESLEDDGLVPTFRRIPVSDERWTRDELVAICNLFAVEMLKERKRCNDVLKRMF